MKIYVLLILCVLFWSGNFILGRYIKDDIEPFEMVFFRWGIVFLIMLPLLIIRFNKIVQVVRQNYLIILVLSVLGISSFNTLLYIGLQTTTATNALIINSSIPMIILFLSHLILKQHITIRQTSGIILSTVGVVYLITKGDIGKLASLEFNSGDLWIVGSSLAWAFYSIFLRFKPKQLNDFEFFTTIVTIGFFIILLLYLSKGYSVAHEIEVFKSNYFVFIYISIFASILSYYFWHQGIANIGASKTGQFTHLMPIFGVMLAYIFLDEKLLGYHFIGMILIGFGIYLSLFYSKKLN